MSEFEIAVVKALRHDKLLKRDRKLLTCFKVQQEVNDSLNKKRSFMDMAREEVQEEVQYSGLKINLTSVIVERLFS